MDLLDLHHELQNAIGCGMCITSGLIQMSSYLSEERNDEVK